MAHTFNRRLTAGSFYWDFKVDTYTLTLAESNTFHAGVISLLNHATLGTFYRSYMEGLAEVEMAIGVRPALAKFVEQFKNDLGFDTIPDPEVPPELIE